MAGFLNDQLSKRTSIFGLHLWVVLGICVGAAIVLIMFLISLWFFTSKRHRHRHTNSNKNPSKLKPSSSSLQKPIIPNVSREIQEIRIDPSRVQFPETLKPNPLPEPEPVPAGKAAEEGNPIGEKRIHIEIGKGHRISYPAGSSSNGSGERKSGDQAAAAVVCGPEVSHLGWGHWYTLRELEVATNGFGDENVIGEGGYGIVYSGVLEDNSMVAVKNLLNNREQLGLPHSCFRQVDMPYLKS